jgi:hypothetical protein
VEEKSLKKESPATDSSEQDKGRKTQEKIGRVRERERERERENML